MNVLLVSHTYFPARYRGKLRWLSVQDDIELSLLAIPKVQLANRPPLEFEITREPFRVHLFKPVFFQNHNNLRFFSLMNIRKLIGEIKPDIVHVEAEPHSLTLFEFAFLKSIYKYKLIAFTWENIYRKMPQPFSMLERYSLKRADWMIAGNSEAVSVLRRRGYAGATSVIPQVGVDPEHFNTRYRRPDFFENIPEGIKIGYIGRLVPQKGVLDLLEAFIPLADRAVLIIIGEGALRQTIIDLAEKRGIKDRVFFSGFIPYNDLPAYLQNLDILVLPSRTTSNWKEQFGHVLAEAMISGVPVIGSTSGAIPEVIGEAGIIFPEGDVNSLYRSLDYLIKVPKERIQYRKKGKTRVQDIFTSESLARATNQLYKEVLTLK